MRIKGTFRLLYYVGAALYIPDINFSLNWNLNPDHSVISAELFAIKQALLWIVTHASHSEKYVICSDSRSGLQLLAQRRPSSYKDIVFTIHSILLRIIDKGIITKFQWTPAHCGINGNEQADQAAKNTRHLAPTVLSLDKCEKTSIHKRVLLNLIQQSWEANAPRTRIGAIKPSFEAWPWAERTNRHEETLLSNFRLGNPPLNKYLHKVKISNTPNCNWCPNTPEDSNHFFFHCRFYRSQRRALFQKLQLINIRDPTIKILLGGGGFSPTKNKQIIDLVCAFFKATKRFQYL